VIGRTVDLIELPGIENVTLSGTGGFAVTGDAEDNVLIGNAGHNTLTGNAGNDTLDGKGGRDNMWGGPGDDIYYVNLPGDGVNESFDQGTDTVRSTISFTLEHLPYVENVELLGAGPLFALGNAAPNRLVGNAGMNSLNGQGGNDILEGGAGIDLLLGGDGDDELYGGDGDDGLHGGAGNDLLDGGAGADIMTGGPGDDLFIFDDPGDMALEVPGGGNDTIRSSATVEHGFLGVERIELTGADHIDASGGAGDEVIVGNSANNSLNGGGGADTLEGGDGDDRFVFDRTDTYNGQLGSVTGGAGFDMLAFTLANGVFASGYAASGIEGIDLTAAGAQTLSITAQDVVDFADSDEIRVLGNQDDVLVFSEPWNLLGTEEIAGALYYRYEAGAATLFVDTDIIVQS
jgi:Ca2+-binding RTX toxin-like protein